MPSRRPIYRLISSNIHLALIFSDISTSYVIDL